MKGESLEPIIEKIEKIYPKYEKKIEQLFQKGLKQLKEFTCIICGYGKFDITKEWKCPKCKTEYEGFSDTFDVRIAEKLCEINTKILKEALGKEYEDYLEIACKLGKCPLEGDCPLEAR